MTNCVEPLPIAPSNWALSARKKHSIELKPPFWIREKRRRPPVEAAFLLVAIPVTVMMVARIIVVVAMMIAVVAMMVVVMMITVPSCGWDRAAGRDYANNT
jgi:hypothetical protein